MVDLNKSHTLAGRVLMSAYYTDGDRLYETRSIGATGCVVFRDCCTARDRCLSIEDFRAQCWLVKPAAAEAA